MSQRYRILPPPDEAKGVIALYLKYKELAHVAGFLILLIFTLGTNWNKWEAQGEDIKDLKSRTSKLEYTNAQILQNLLDIRDFLHVPQHP